MNIEKRTESLNAVRKQNKVPGVLFGKSITPVSIQIDALELAEAFRQNGKTQTFAVKLGRETHQVYIKNLQKDAVNRNLILNVELLKVDKGDMIVAKIPIHILGRDVIEKEGWLVQVVADDVEVEYEAGKGIQRVDVDIRRMHVREVLHVADIVFPEGIKVLDEGTKALVHIAEHRIVEEPVAETAVSTEAPAPEPAAPKEEA
ncbi:MAG: 50S ribosomal protein L25 [Candidatus Izemoplasmatales bacterium]